MTSPLLWSPVCMYIFEALYVFMYVCMYEKPSAEKACMYVYIWSPVCRYVCMRNPLLWTPVCMYICEAQYVCMYVWDALCCEALYVCMSVKPSAVQKCMYIYACEVLCCEALRNSLATNNEINKNSLFWFKRETLKKSSEFSFLSYFSGFFATHFHTCSCMKIMIKENTHIGDH